MFDLLGPHHDFLIHVLFFRGFICLFYLWMLEQNTPRLSYLRAWPLDHTGGGQCGLRGLLRAWGRALCSGYAARLVSLRVGSQFSSLIGFAFIFCWNTFLTITLEIVCREYIFQGFAFLGNRLLSLPWLKFHKKNVLLTSLLIVASTFLFLSSNKLLELMLARFCVISIEIISVLSYF